MQCLIISPENKREFTDIKSITLPGFFGELQVLPGHAESFIVLQKGQIILESEKIHVIPVEGGVCHLKSDILTIIL